MDEYGTFEHEISVAPTQKRFSFRWTYVLQAIFSVIVIHLCVSNYRSEDALRFRGYVDETEMTVVPSRTTYACFTSNKSAPFKISEYHTVLSEEYVACGKFNDSLHSIGWSQLWIDTRPLNQSYASRKEAMYAAGFVEGALTRHRIDEHYFNTYKSFFPEEKDGKVADGVREFIRENLEWMRRNSDSYLEVTTDDEMSDYWLGIGAIIAQLDGLVAGYQSQFDSRESNKMLSAIDLFLLNTDGDLEDLKPLAKNNFTDLRNDIDLNEAESLRLMRERSLKCSALIKVVQSSSKFVDLLWGHTTWDQYSALNRIFKHYTLPEITKDVSGTEITARKLSFSSSPGYITSADDFYILGNGMGVMETTNGIYDDKLYGLISPTGGVLTFIRSALSNMIANDGQEWVRTFSTLNSGTYNDQWMIIDTRRFPLGDSVESHEKVSGLLYVLEQIPGTIVARDMSVFLLKRGYWDSFNVPYFTSIYQSSGFYEKYIKQDCALDISTGTNEWSYEENTRAQLFGKLAGDVQDVGDLKRVLRYNEWKKDELSMNHAAKAIAARYDLETTEAYWDLNGAIDTKVTSLKAAQKMTCEAVSGPTVSESCPPFRWDSVSFPDGFTEQEKEQHMLPHLGHPSVFRFGFEVMVHSAMD